MREMGHDLLPQDQRRLEGQADPRLPVRGHRTWTMPAASWPPTTSVVTPARPGGPTWRPAVALVLWASIQRYGTPGDEALERLFEARRADTGEAWTSRTSALHLGLRPDGLAGQVGHARHRVRPRRRGEGGADPGGVAGQRRRHALRRRRDRLGTARRGAARTGPSRARWAGPRSCTSPRGRRSRCRTGRTGKPMSWTCPCRATRRRTSTTQCSTWS